MKKISKLLFITFLAVIVISTVIWGISLLKCEVLTNKYYADFEHAYQGNAMLSDIEFFKVLNCDGKTAEVYYVSKNMTDANVLTFINQDGVWVETNWKTIWSSSGSASGVIYPYFWHVIYGGI